MTITLPAAQSLAKFQDGSHAASQGQLQQALKDFSASISFSPTPEAYLAQAEVLFAIGQPRQALERIRWVENRISILPNSDGLDAQVAQLKAKHSQCQSPNVDTTQAINQELRLIIPVKAKATKDIYMRLTDRSSLNSTDGITLINKRTQGVVYSVAVRNSEPESIDMMLSCGQGRLPFNHVKSIKEHTHLVHLSGPNPIYASRVKTQLDLASDILHTASILAQELESAAVYVATAGMTHTTESFCGMNAVRDLPALLSAFVQRIGGKGSFYTCGMHALGYADVRLEADLSAQDAARLVFEFLQFTLVKNLRGEVTRFPFKSAELLKDFDVELSECGYFDAEEPFYNQNGIWTLRHMR
jgi:tetratricopeptide (TPR) repeat protein